LQTLEPLLLLRVMRYQDMKLRDAAKIAMIGAVIAVAFTVSLCFRSLFSERFLDGPYVPLMVAMGISALLAAGGVVWYLGTTPAQNANFLERHKRRVPENFDWTLLDASNPHFHTPTWQYLRRRRHERK
jgi:hypothetical protein